MSKTNDYVVRALDIAIALLEGRVRTQSPDYVEMLQSAKDAVSGDSVLTEEDWALQERLLSEERAQLHGVDS